VRQSLRLGHIAGVSIGAHWSVLVIFTLLTVALAAGRFPDAYPDRPALTYAVAGTATGLVFFVSLLAHELSHAFVARRHGIEVDSITLWVLGGVASLRGRAPGPTAEMQVAGVGPLVSMGLGVVFLVAAGLAALLGTSELLAGSLLWLGMINVVLAAFNLIPAAPLDGGRILKAYLWRLRGDRTSASITAAKAGQAFGWVLGSLGLIVLFLLDGFGGLWFVFLGWFLINAARAEEEQARVLGVLDGVRIDEVMSHWPAVAPEGCSVETLVEDYVFQHPHSTFPLVDQAGHPRGLVTMARIKRVPPDQRAATPVGDIACSLDEVAVAHPGDLVADLLPRLTECSDGRAIVVEDTGDRSGDGRAAGRVVGIVSPRDVIDQLERLELGAGRSRSRLEGRWT